MQGPHASEHFATAVSDAEGGASAGFHASAAMVRAETQHLDATINALVKRLSSVPGLEVKVSPRRGALRKLIGDLPYIGELGTRSAHVHEVSVCVGESSYWLHAREGSITCGRSTTRADGRHEQELPFTDWASALFDEIAQRNLANHDAMAALRRLVEQDRV